MKEEVRPATCISSTLARALSNSSDSPSEKYSFSVSLLIFTNGSTAIEAVSILAIAPASSKMEALAKKIRSTTTKNKAMDNTEIITPFSFFPVRSVTDSVISTSLDFLIPSGVSSKAQAKIKVSGNPIPTNTITTVSNQSGMFRGASITVTI